jgi:hypothetical protein
MFHQFGSPDFCCQILAVLSFKSSINIHSSGQNIRRFRRHSSETVSSMTFLELMQFSDVYKIAGLGCNKFRTQSTDIVSSMWAVEMFVFNDVHRGGVLLLLSIVTKVDKNWLC